RARALAADRAGRANAGSPARGRGDARAAAAAMRGGRPVRLLFVLCGGAQPEMAARCGNYEDWFRHALPDVGWDTQAAHVGGWRPPDLSDYAGVLVSGSPASVARPERWMEELGELVRTAAQRGTPVLGVCFGHQLCAWAFGARVEKNPNG